MAGWARIEIAVIEMIPKIGLSAFAVYCALAMHGDASGYCYPGIRRLAEIVGVNAATVRRAIARLKDASLLRVEHRLTQAGDADTNGYLLTPPKVRASVQGPTTDASTVCASVQGPPDTGARTVLAPVQGGVLAPVRTKLDPVELDPKNRRFTVPSLEEVVAYCQERRNKIDPEAFIDHYVANGWKVGGKTPMKDWKSAIRNWERMDRARNGNGHSSPYQTLDLRLPDERE